MNCNFCHLDQNVNFFGAEFEPYWTKVRQKFKPNWTKVLSKSYDIVLAKSVVVALDAM